MKLADIHNPARFDWLADQGFRLDASPYLSGAYEARKLLERLPGTQPLPSSRPDTMAGSSTARSSAAST